MPIQKSPFKLFEDFDTIPSGAVRKRWLRYDVNALADFEQETGMGFGQLMSQKAIFAVARGLLWVGLKHEDRTLTITSVGTLIAKWMAQDRKKNSIDTILTTCFQAAKDQGAFGDIMDDEPQDEGTEGDGAPNKGNDSSGSATPNEGN